MIYFPRQCRGDVLRFYHILSSLTIRERGTTEEINKTLYPYRGMIGFKQYNPKKPAKYGLLFRSLCDSSIQYIFFIAICWKTSRSCGQILYQRNRQLHQVSCRKCDTRGQTKLHSWSKYLTRQIFYIPFNRRLVSGERYHNYCYTPKGQNRPSSVNEK